MNTQFWLLKHAEILKFHYKKWFQKETMRELLLPVSMTTAHQLLKAAFASSNPVSKDFLFDNYKYTWQVNDTGMAIHFSVYGKGKGSLDYSIHAQVFSHESGSRLVLAVKPENSFLLVLPLGLAIFSILSKKGIFEASWSTLFFSLVYLAVTFWDRKSAVNKLSGYMLKIISNHQNQVSGIRSEA